MNIIKTLYRKTGWHTVFNYSDEAGSARSDILIAGSFGGVINALSEGVFFTGFLLCYGINIVNISILSAVPFIASFFSLLTPRLLTRFKKRRMILSMTRALYYIVRILGITLLPQIVRSDAGRLWGLVGITFVSSAINFSFTSGYSVWHMHYIGPEVRAPYHAAINITSAMFQNLIPLLISLWVDTLQGQAQLNAFILLRLIALTATSLEIFFYQRPREPEYVETSDHQSLLDVLRIPLHNSRFRLTMAIFCFYTVAISVCNPMVNAWLLDVVHTGFRYTSVLSFLYIPCAVLTQGFWSRLFRRWGTFRVMVLALLLYMPSRVMAAFVNHDNYMWLMTAARLLEYSVWMGVIVSVNNLIFVNLPKKDQTCFLSFFTLLGNLAAFGGRMVGTWTLAQIGDGTVGFGALRFGAIPATQLLEGLLVTLVAIFTAIVRKKVDSGPNDCYLEVNVEKTQKGAV